MIDEIDLKYEKICKKNNYGPGRGEQNKKGKNNADSTAITMRDFKGYRGRCHFCGNFGHKQTKCPYKNTNGNQKANNNYGKQNNQKETTLNPTHHNSNDYVPPRRHRFDKKFDHCGKWGHKKEDC